MRENYPTYDLDHALADGPFETQTRLTQIAMAVPVEGMISDIVCPATRTGYKFTFTQLDTGDRFTVPDVRASRAAELNEVEFGAEDVTASTVPYGLVSPVPFRDIDEAARQEVPYDPLENAAMSTAALVKLAREKRVATLLTTLNNYDANLRATLAGNAQWSHASADPLNAILEAADKMLVKPNLLAMGRQVWTKLRQHSKIVEAINMSGAGAQAAGAVMRQAVADLVEVDQVVVGDAWNQTAKPGQDEAYGRVWGKDAALLHVNPQPAGAMDKRPTFCFTAEAMPLQVMTYDAPGRGVGRGSTVVKASEECKEIISWKGVGYLFKSAVA